MFPQKLVKKDVLVVMALPSESQGLFEKENIEVCYTGIGKVNAAISVTQAILEKKPKYILNLGTAGSAKFKTHDLVECTGFVQRDMDISPLGFKIGETPLDPIPGQINSETLTRLPKGICGTGDSFEVGPPRLACDLVDMEAFALAKACKKMGVPLTSIKYITDGSDKDAHKDWVANLLPAAKKLLEVYQSICS